MENVPADYKMPALVLDYSTYGYTDISPSTIHHVIQDKFEKENIS